MILGLIPVFVGCSSITKGSTQTVNITTTERGNITEAQCQVSNDKFTTVVRTPGNVQASRSSAPLNLTCQTPTSRGSKTVESRTNAEVFGNILFGGPIGAAIDVGTGAAFDYPNSIVFELFTFPTSQDSK